MNGPLIPGLCLGAVLFSAVACTRFSVDLEGLACDQGRCLDGYRCDELTQLCVAEAALGDGNTGGGDGLAGDAGDAGAGDARVGDPGSGDPGVGDPGVGDAGVGDPGVGDAGVGDPGDAGVGDPGMGDPGMGDPGAGDPGLACGWWSSSYRFRRPLTVTNNAASTMPSGYSVVVVLDHGSLTPARSRTDGDDLRIVTCDGTELDRLDASPMASGYGTSSFDGPTTALAFATTAAVPPGASDDAYYLYYGFAAAGTPPADPAGVFDFWESFDGLGAWTVVGTPGESVGGGYLDVDGLNAGDLLYITGAGGDRSGSTGFAVRARALQLDLGNDLGPVGWHHDTNTGVRYDISASGSVNRIRYWGSLGGVGATLFGDGGAAIPAASTWYVYEATIEGADFGFVRDGTIIGSATDSTLSSGKVHINGECGTARWDWLLIRHLVSPEPTVALGAEEP